MTPYGKVSQAAIAAASFLAEQFSTQGGKRLNSREIAEKRRLSQAIVAKVLTTLSQAGLVTGSPGPGGGYTLARDPKLITLQHIVEPFERQESTLTCPFGEGWCGTGPQCPLHQQLESLRHQMREFLTKTTLASFQNAGSSPGKPVPLLPITSGA